MDKKVVFPCKSINLVKFLKSRNIFSVYKHVDVVDSRDCWLYIRNEELNKALTDWKNSNPNRK